MSDEDFEVSFPDLPPVRLFCEDPLENLRLHVLVKRVPQQVQTSCNRRISDVSFSFSDQYDNLTRFLVFNFSKR
jgi:hypothetical protein